MSTKAHNGLPYDPLMSALGPDNGWKGQSLGTYDAIVLIHSLYEKIFL